MSCVSYEIIVIQELLCEMSGCVSYEIIAALHGSMHVVLFTVQIMPRCACASEVYGSVSVSVCLCVCVCVCLSVCVDCYSCSRMNQVQVRVSIGF